MTKTAMILLALTACLWAAPSTNAVALTSEDPQWLALACPGCGRAMKKVYVEIRPGQWAWLWYCPRPTCNPG